MEVLRLFNFLVHRYPKSMEMITAFGITFNADLVCQFIDSKSKNRDFLKNVNLRRAFNLGAFRAIAVPPVMHYWYKFINFHYPWKSFEVVLIKSLFDRMTIGGVLIAAFFGSQTYMNGGSHQDFVEKMEKNFVPTFQTNILFWTGLMAVNYKYVPHHFQTIYFNCITFVWMIYLSHSINYKKNGDRH
jgi:hypothetical protein